MKKTHFEWDEKKNAENALKHRLSFYEAQKAFLNPHRIIGAGYWRKGKKVYEQARR